MQFNYYFLKQLTVALENRLIGKKIDSIFSQNKDELILAFVTSSDSFYIKANLASETSLLSYPSEFARAKKNSINLFESIYGLSVVCVRQFINERSFAIKLEKNYSLVFKLHGRYSNIILFDDNSLATLFRQNLKSDLDIVLNEIDRNIDQSEEHIVRSDFNLAELFPTFDKNIKSFLISSGFNEETDSVQKMFLLKNLLLQLEDQNFYLEYDQRKPKLLLFKSNNEQKVFHDPIEISNHLAHQIFSIYNLQCQKTSILVNIQKEIKKCESYIKKAYNKLTELKSRRKYDELANILMANVHLKIDREVSSLSLLDFYTNENIMIRIKSNLSIQDNAAILYRKAKNQSKESNILNKNLKNKKILLDELIEKKILIEEVNSVKELKPYIKSSDKNKNPTINPFINIVINDYQVYIGRNAKNNDLLTQKYARKDDVWLHARDVSGSHVVIKNPSGGKVPLSTIEKVAQLAAWYSKRKSDTLCPVIYTPKKYVRKPKGSLPGQVLISREDVILVEPSNALMS